MKIKRVESIVKNIRRITVRWRDGVQWLGDGAGMYPLHGFPLISEDNAFKLFDISEDKKEKFTYTEGEWPESYDLSDTSPTDVPAERSPLQIIESGMSLLPLHTPDGVLFVNVKYLQPFADEENGVELYVRKGGNQKLIAVKAGFFLVGLIAPVEFGRQDELRKIIK